MQTETVLYSRYQDGAKPVIVTPTGFTVGSTTYRSKRSLIAGLTGHPEARHWTFDRYFKQGRHTPPRHLDSPDLITLLSDIVVATPQQTSFIVDSHPLGIDLDNRAGEVAKLLYAGFGPMIIASGYEFDDVLQEVYKGLITRNHGTCPWDSRISTFGHYVHMVCRCVLANYHRKQSKRRQHEQLGLPGYDECGQRGMVDAGSAKAVVPEGAAIQPDGEVFDTWAVESLEFQITKSRRSSTKEARLALRVLPLIRDGYKRGEIADTIGESPASVSRAMAFLRSIARTWATA